LMVATVVVHDVQHRNLVMRCRPENARRIVQIPVGLDVDGETSIFPVCERGSNGCGSAVSNAIGSVAANELMVFRKVPKPSWPETLKHDVGHQRPVLALNLVPDFGRQASC